MSNIQNRYFISIILQGSLEAINFFINQTNEDFNLMLFSTFIKNIIDKENLKFNLHTREDCIFDENDKNYFSVLELSTEIKTNNINKLRDLLKQDQERINEFVFVALKQRIEFFVAAKKLTFNENNYITI